MFEPETVKFLESGCALVVGSVDADRAPHATRGWGLTVVSQEPPTVRLLLDALETDAIDNVRSTGALAITGTRVPTLHSMQLKGQVVATEDANDADRTKAAAFVDAFYRDVHETEGTDRTLLDRMTPASFIAVVVEVCEFYDQTPGPEAGAALGGGGA